MAADKKNVYDISSPELSRDDNYCKYSDEAKVLLERGCDNSGVFISSEKQAISFAHIHAGYHERDIIATILQPNNNNNQQTVVVAADDGDDDNDTKIIADTGGDRTCSSPSRSQSCSRRAYVLVIKITLLKREKVNFRRFFVVIKLNPVNLAKSIDIF